MGKSPAFQFYPADWLSSPKIMLMTPAEEGAYIRLLAIAWESEDCSLPDDDAILARLSRLNDDWTKGGSSLLRQCFVSRNGRLYNERLLQEREKQRQWREKSSQGGKKSWEVRENIGKMTKKGWTKGGSEMVQSNDEPKPNSSSSSSSSLKENPPISPPKKKGGTGVVFSELQEKQFNQFWDAYPKKQKKEDARKAWLKIKPDDPLLQNMLQAVKTQEQSEQWQKEEGQYIPMPATWLNGKRWEDEIGPIYQKPDFIV